MPYFSSIIGPALARPVRLILALLLALPPLLAQAGPPVLRLEATITTGDVTAFVDQVEIVNAVTGAVVVGAVPNAGFETFGTLANGSYGYQPAGATWSFNSRSGITSDGGALGNPAASPEGTHAAFLQPASGGTAIEQALPGLAAGYYQVRVQLAQRNYGAADQGVRLLVDGRALGSSAPANDGVYHGFTSAVFAVGAELRFEGAGGANSPGFDVTAFLDQLELVDAGTGAAVTGGIANASFETTGSLGSDPYGYRPTGTGWTFVDASGIATNGSAFAAPTAPDGTHVGFVQRADANVGIRQVLGGALAGSYQLRVKAAVRTMVQGGYSAPSDQRVLVWLNNQLLATLAPANNGSFQAFTIPFTLALPPGPVISSFTPGIGGVGTTLSLTGTNLNGTTAITFTGGSVVNSGYRMSADGTSITGLVVPAGAQSGPLTATASGGLGAVSAQAFTLVALPTLTQVSPYLGITGTVLTLTGTNLAGTTSIKFTGSAGVKTVTSGFTVNAAGTQITGLVVPAGAQSGPLTVTSAANATSLAGPALFSRAKTLAAGYAHTAAVRADGTLWTWGWNFSAQIGDGTTTDRNAPTQIGTAANWATVTAGTGHTVAVRTDGTLWAWGNGLIGDGTTLITHYVPVQIGTATNWATVAAGRYYTVAVRADGTLWAWGQVPTYGDRSEPFQIGTDTNWATVAAGSDHAVAVRSDGTLWTWGANYNGQLGIGTIGSASSGLTQVGTDTNWVSMAAGEYHTLAIKADGTLWSWGRNEYGQLGYYTFNPNYAAPKIMTTRSTGQRPPNQWVTAAANRDNSLAIKADGTAWVWGGNDAGELGYHSESYRPSDIPGTDWTSIAAGELHSAGEQSCRAIWAWGDNSAGQIGIGLQGNVQFREPQLVIGAAPGLVRFTPASAPVGATVVVTGTGLAGLTALSVNGTDALASVTDNTDTSFSFVVPAGATAMGTTTVAAGCGSAGTAAFTVLPCLTAALQNPTLPLVATGTGTIAADAFDAGSTASCGAITFGVQKLRTGTVYGTMAEPGLLALTAPAGAVFTAVDFASFGNPTGSNGNYAPGNCDAPISLSRVREALLNQGGTVSISASSGFFGGDLCVGTSKRLAVRATYTYPLGSAAPSLDYACADLGPQPVLLTLTDAQGVSTTRTVGLTVAPPAAATLTGLNPAGAAPGATVTATGTNLSGATALTVNGAAAAIGNLTATGFTFVVPAGAAASGNLGLSLSCTQVLTPAFTVGAPLPVELVQFTAALAGPAVVRLAWTTTSEQNSRAFEVERSPDGRAFARIGTVAAAGTSTAPRNYELLDDQLPAGAALLYYRLRQVDLDGTFSYSPVRTVVLTGAAAGLALYPNPVSGGAAVLTGALPGTVVAVFDALGRSVTTASADAMGTAVLALPAGLPTGVYIVRTGNKALRLTVE